MVIKKTIKKEDIKEMPKVLFPGRIHLVQTPWEAEKAVTYLKKYSLLGIDSETRPSFTKGQSHKVALLQVSSEEDCFLFRLNLTGLTLPIISLLESPSVTKVGLSLRDDFMMLHKRAPLNNIPASSCKNMSVCSAYRTRVCKKSMVSCSVRKYPNHNVSPTGKLSI